MAHALRALALLALLVASLGRLPAAEAAAPDHAAMMSAGHCSDMPAPDQPEPMSIDCMIACAAIVPPACASVQAPVPAADPAEPALSPRIAGISAGADPPPPRFS